MGLRIAGTSSTNHQATDSSGGPMILTVCTAGTLDSPRTKQLISIISSQLSTHGIGIKMVSIDELMSIELKRTTVQTPMLIILSEHDSDRVINQLADMLATHLSPALVLLDNSHAHATLSLRSMGIMCEPIDIDPVHASIILWTLAQRQPAIQQLATELRITEMSINSVHNEINKLHEELQTAATIQREYMPIELPKISGLDMGVVYRPASYVSGDIYDIIELDEDHTGFFLADAVGHGVPAALMTMVITQGLHKTEGEGKDTHIIPPGEALRRLNNTMTEHAGEQARFATAVYAIHNKRANTITIAGAGHPPSLLIRKDTGEVEHLESDGPLLGVFPDVPFGQETVALHPGDVFIMYSDGFEVAFPSKDAIGDERKRPTLTYLKELADAGSGYESLSDAIGTLESRLDNQTGSLHQPDDITAIFIAPLSESSTLGLSTEFPTRLAS